ncbi:MAG: cadherin-like domain-containing protein, partial [Chloroflexaceae bacterium]|nr:cadherin-like domain-containing protein [Chloroflexaceae bacterium]
LRYLTFGPGERTKDIVLTINNDLRDEADETVVLGFSTRAANSTTVVGNEKITVTITDDDTPPTTAADSYSVAEDAVLNVPAAGVLGNDSDSDGTPFTAALVSDVSNGTLTLNADGSFSYAPNANFFGSDSFSYKAVDSGTNESAAATVTITVTPTNDAPTATNDTASVGIDSRDNQLMVLGNDTDVDGDTLRITAVTAATRGSISVSSDGLHLLYTPNPGYEGSDQASYTISDGNGGTATATVTINVVRFRLFLPMISNPGVADLSTRISVSPDREIPTDRVLVSVTVTNNGTAPASGFWVDLYINPSRVPQVNEPWSDLCAVERCEGLAWFVPATLAPGQSITLVSMPQDNATPNGYSQENSRWRGLLPNGVVQLHAYADSWNRDAGGAERSPFGAVYERDESNNRASLELRDLE